MLAEIVDTHCRNRARADLHKHPLYYPVRNHIIDFLVTRSKTFMHEQGAAFDPRNVALVRPGLPEPMTAVAGENRHASLAGHAR